MILRTKDCDFLTENCKAGYNVQEEHSNRLVTDILSFVTSTQHQKHASTDLVFLNGLWLVQQQPGPTENHGYVCENRAGGPVANAQK